MAVLCSLPRDARCLVGNPIAVGMTSAVRDMPNHSQEAHSAGNQSNSATGLSNGGTWAGGLIDVAPGTTESSVLLGFFKADSSGVAQEFLDCLRDKLEISRCTDCEDRLSDAFHACLSEFSRASGLMGAAVLLEGSDLAYVAQDQALVGIRTFDEGRCCTEILADPTVPAGEAQDGADQPDELGLPNSADSAFGSLIAVDRAALKPVVPVLQSGSFPVDSKRLYLVMGLNVSESQCTFAAVKDRIVRAMERKAPASTFAVLSLEGAPQQHHTAMYSLSCRSLGKQPEQKMPEFHSKLSFKDVEVSPFQDGIGSPPKDRVMRNSTSYSTLAFPSTQPPGRDHTEMLSSPSRLVEPSMTIPEDVTLPLESMAGQLPPPLLAPIRKAYPSSQEITISPEMLSSPSPIRKARIGRAASFNSPNGLWMPGQGKKGSNDSPSDNWPLLGHSSLNIPVSTRQDSYFLRERHSHGGHSFGGSTTEERVRGGLPRPTSSSHLSMHGGLTPTASLSASPDTIRDLSESLNSSSLSLQEHASRDSREDSIQGPWNAPVQVAGRKGRGRSAALRMLRSNDENRPPTNQSMPYSAPAGLLGDVKDLSEEDIKTSQSIGSRTSANSGSRTSFTTNDSPRVSGDHLSRTTSVTSSSASRTVFCVPPLSECGNEHSKPRTATVTFAAMPRLVQNPFNSDQILGSKRQESYGHNRRSDSADNTMGDQFRLEGRQRSGMAFSPSQNDRLGDSVRSLTLTEG